MNVDRNFDKALFKTISNCSHKNLQQSCRQFHEIIRKHKLRSIRHLSEDILFSIKGIQKIIHEIHLYYSSQNGDLPQVKYLIEETNIDKDKQYCNGYTSIFSASEHGQVEVCEYLLSQGVSLKSTDNHGNSILHYAIRSCQLPIVKYLLENLGIDINITNDKNETPLHLSCEKGHEEISHYLISKGADIGVKGNNGDSVLHCACKSGLLPIVEYLIETAHNDINLENNNKETPLYSSYENKQFPVIEYLLSQGANLECKQYSDGKSSFKYGIFEASYYGQLNILKILIETRQVDKMERILNTEHFEGIHKDDSILHVSCQRGHLLIVRYLIEEQSFDINIRGYCDKTPLHYAVEQNQYDLIEYLISKGASTKCKDTLRNFALDYDLLKASKEGKLEIVRSLIETPLVEERKDPNQKDYQNNSLILILEIVPTKHHFTMRVNMVISKLSNILFVMVLISIVLPMKDLLHYIMRRRMDSETLSNS